MPLIKISQAYPLVAVLLCAVAPVWTGCNGGGGANPVNDDGAVAVTIQGDGRIVAAGNSYAGASYDRNFALARYNPDGSLEATFGAGGKVTTNIANDDRVVAVAVQSDGKIVAVGYSYDGFDNFTLARYDSSGSLDATFGYGGKVKTALGGGAQAVALQGDGGIVAAGYSDNGAGGTLALVRYRSDGALDNTFGAGGKVVTADVDGGASDVALQADGKIVAVGNSSNGGGYQNFILARYHSSGSLDNTFGAGGKVTMVSTYHDTLTAVALQTDGMIVAAGSSYDVAGGYDLALRRFNSDGSPDNTFGTDGKVLATVRGLYPLRASVVPSPGDGKIVVAGYSDSDLVLARYNGDGSPDTAFGTGGKVTAATSSIGVLVSEMAVQSDGKIVVVGRSYIYRDPTGYDFALMRYNSDGSPDTAFGSGGKVITAY